MRRLSQICETGSNGFINKPNGRVTLGRKVSIDALCEERSYFVGTTVRCFTLPDFETNAVKVNSLRRQSQYLEPLG